MKIVKVVDKDTDQKRRYTHWLTLIEEFSRSKREIVKIYRSEDSWIDDKTFISIVNAIRTSVKRSGYAMTVMKRHNEIYLIKVVKVELVDF